MHAFDTSQSFSKLPQLLLLGLSKFVPAAVTPEVISSTEEGTRKRQYIFVVSHALSIYPLIPIISILDLNKDKLSMK